MTPRTTSQVLVLVFFTLFLANSCKPPAVDPLSVYYTPFRNSTAVELDSMLDNMTLEEKVGQLIGIKGTEYSLRHSDSLLQLIQPGLVWNFPHLLKSDSIFKRPPLVADDQVPILPEDHPFPNENALAANPHDSLVLMYEQLKTRRMKQLGVHVYILDEYHLPQFQPFRNSPFPDPKLLRPRELEKIRLSFDYEILPAVSFSADQTDPCGDPEEAFWQNPFLEQAGIHGLSVMLIDTFLLRPSLLAPMDSVGQYISTAFGFDGLIVVPATHIPAADLPHYFNTGVDIFLTDSLSTSLKENFVQLFRKKKLSTDLLDQKVRKVLQAKAWSGVLNPVDSVAPSPPEPFDTPTIGFYPSV